MKTNGLRALIYKGILLILLSLYFLLVFGESASAPLNRDFGASLRASIPLPKLLSFEGVVSNKQVKLNWQFETTEGLDECIVERADKSGEFKPVAYFFITEDIHIPNLHFTDNVTKNRTYYYRLKITGKDGDKQYTKTLTFQMKKQDQKQSLNYPLVLQ